MSLDYDCDFGLSQISLPGHAWRGCSNDVVSRMKYSQTFEH